MAKIRVSGRPSNSSTGVVVREEDVGQASGMICYPGVSSCISVTCLSGHGLSGTHLTVSTEPALVDNAMQYLKGYTAGGASALYIVGKLTEFRMKSKDARLKTAKTTALLLQGALNYRGKIRYYDTTGVGDAHIYAVKSGFGVDFFWQGERKGMVNGYEMPDIIDYTMIRANDLMVQ
ncbi:MAG: hypothetical protein ACKVPY_03150 [Paracoccaceae bacterium]